jgi:hypothetical protein
MKRAFCDNLRWCMLAMAASAMFSTAARADEGFAVDPPQVQLAGPFARAQLLVRVLGASETQADLTHVAAYRSSRPEVVSVKATGQVQAHADGEAEITITVNNVSRTVPVRVTGASASIRFDQHVLPVMSKAGCNAAACHASQYGQGEFKLSVFGSDAVADHRAIVHAAFGRRVSVHTPEQSLVLLKPTGSVSHGGAVRLDRNSVDYRLFHAWIGAGAAPPITKNAPQVTKLKIVPERRVAAGDFTQQLRVLAEYSDGAQRDVTHWARYDSMDEGVLQVSQDGLIEVKGRGQGTAMARFQGQTAIMQVVVPFDKAPNLADFKENNFIDRLAAAKFRELGLTPAPLADDATFLRRAYLQAIGSPPSVSEARRFLDSNDPDKRKKLVDQLLGLTGDPNQDIHNNSYAAWWGLQWADLLRNRGDDRKQEMWALHNWLQAAFRDNKRFDVFVRELITARGSTVSHGPANFYRIFNTADDRAEGISQIFLGVRMQCAKCHHHPFEAISQADYYGVSAFFTRVGTKSLQDFGVRINNQEIIVLKKGDAKHPRTGAVMAPTPLHGRAAIDTPGDRRQGIAEWITRGDNPYFARNIVNRYWAHFMGRGLVEPVDDLRATNPPTNPELLDALAKEFVRTGYDVKQLIRTIMTSRLYQLDSTASRTRDDDGRFYASFVAKRVAAEPLSDAIDAAAEVTPKFAGVPAGTRAIELPDAVYNDRLLTTFGKPKRESVCDCDRGTEPSLAQALHVLNSEALHAKLTDAKGRVARLVAAKTPFDAVVEELYLATLSRRPTEGEAEACRSLRAQASDAESFYQDLLWSLCNSKQFLYVR